MRITLLNGFGLTANIGDHALLTSTVSLLRTQFPAARIYVVPWQRPNAEMAQGFERLVRGLGDVELGKSILPANQGDIGFPMASLGGKARILAWTAATNLKAELGGMLPFLTPIDSAVRVIEKSDLVVLRGCNIVERGSSPRMIASIRRITFPLSLARKMRKPTILLNISVGPVEHPLARFMVRKALEGASFVSTRESSAQDYVQKMARCHPVLSADTAFAHPMVNSPVGRDPLLVGLNLLSLGEYMAAINQWPRAYDDLIAKTAMELNALMDDLPQVKLLAIPHEMDSAALNSDLKSLQLVKSKLAHPERMDIASDVLDADGIVRTYARCAIAIGMRFHGYVLASLASTPVLGIDIKSHKVNGLAKDLGTDGWLINIDQPGSLVKNVSKALAAAAELQTTVAENTLRLRRRVLETFRDYAESRGFPRGDGNRAARAVVAVP
jgi:polysaccharide pyruvyl transferase WcaK-like protein